MGSAAVRRAIAAAIVTCVALGFAVPIASGLLEDQHNTPSGGGPWEQLPRPPANDVLGGPEQGSAVWTGRELVLLAEFAYSPPIPSRRPPEGLAYPDDGAAYTPHGNRWRPPAKAPVPGRAVPLAVWTGDRAIFIGGMNLGD